MKFLSFLSSTTAATEPAQQEYEPFDVYEDDGESNQQHNMSDTEDDTGDKHITVYAIFHNKELLGYKTSYKSAKRVCKRVAKDVMMRMISNFPCYLYKWNMRYEANNKVTISLIRDPKLSLLCSPTQRYAQVEDVLTIQRIKYIKN
jgi:hypothetical protein